MPPRQAAQWGGQIADALAAAHRRGIIYRDVKPENVMVCETGAVKLLDFGLAKAASGSLSTIQGAILGTVNYMSPEQALGGAADARSDIFSCGALLYEMITGRRAFTGDSPAAILAAVLQRDPMSDDAVSRMPPELRRITSRCLEKNPAKRFQRMSEVRGALAECSLNSGSLNLVSDGWKRKTAVAASILFIVGFARVAPSLHQFPRPNRPDTTAQSIDRADNRKLALEDFRCGFSSYGHWAPNEMNAAGGKFLSVVQLLPHGWQGYFGLAKTHLAETLLSGRSFDAKRKTIMGYAERAVELGPEIAVTHATLAAASLLLEWRWTDAEREIEQAIRWNPNNGEPYERRGQLRALQGRFADADRDFARALELRPDFDDCRLSRAWGDFLAGQPDLAIARVHDVIAATKKKGQAYRLLAGAHGAKGEFKEAGDALAKAWLPPLDKLNVEAWLAARQGNRRSAEAILEKIEALCRREELEYCDTALPETALGRYDRALDSLERGLRLRHWQLLFQSVDPRLNPLHGNPRWGEIILRLRSPY
jgi:tetratricopeptide (TPR) repeat protein